VWCPSAGLRLRDASAEQISALAACSDRALAIVGMNVSAMIATRAIQEASRRTTREDIPEL
jgi:hypothetical protein